MRRLYILALGFVVSILGFAVGPLNRAAYASACTLGTKCTYYYSNNSTADGLCGQYDPTQVCVCTAANQSQNQSACGAPPA